MIAVLLGLMFTSCVKDDFYFELEEAFNYEIAESEEFREYVEASFAFGEYLKRNDTSQMQFVGTWPNGKNLYKGSIEEVLLPVKKKYDALIKKYPEYKKLTKKQCDDMYIHAVMSSYELQKKTGINKAKLLTRSLNSNPETIAFSIVPNASTIGNYFIRPYVLVSDAIDECRSWSHAHKAESGGFCFEDYSSLFVADTRATGSNMNLPILNWGDNTPIYAFHYHAYSSDLSAQDSASMDTMGFPLYVIFDGYFLTLQ